MPAEKIYIILAESEMNNNTTINELLCFGTRTIKDAVTQIFNSISNIINGMVDKNKYGFLGFCIGDSGNFYPITKLNSSLIFDIVKKEFEEKNDNMKSYHCFIFKPNDSEVNKITYSIKTINLEPKYEFNKKRSGSYRTVCAKLSVWDQAAIDKDMGTLDYIEQQIGNYFNGIIKLENARILDDDDPEDTKAINKLDEIFDT